MKLLSREGDRGIVEMGGVRRNVVLTLTPDAAVGEFVIVHAGYALEVLDERAAAETLALLRDLGGDVER